jgi:peptidoglycan hydrolase-like protein with peptidoglycan-binding domain
MTRAHFMTALLGFALAWCAMPTARSDQLRIALVICNDEYGSQPGPKRCSASATAVRDVLRGKGFKIIDRDNLDRAEFDSAIGALARRVAASPASLAVLYYCGYGLEFDGQSFLLSTSATISQDNDVLTQGIVAKNVVDSLGAAPQSRGFVLLDVFRTPNAAATGLGRLIEQVISSNFAVIGASNDGPGEGPTAASLALRDQFAEAEMDLDSFVVRMSRQLSRESAVMAHFVPAIGPRPGPRASPLLAPATAEASTAVPVQPVPAVSNAVQPTAAPATTSTSSVAVPSMAIAAASTAAPVPPASAPPQPAANASPLAPPSARIVVQPPTLSREDKRLIQTILTQMGYNAGQIDGKFGPETQAAIRRYQLEINVDATGRLTSEQVTKLLCAGCLPPPAPRDDAAYCAALSALYRRYLGSAGEGHFPEAAASVAMDECARGNTAVGILVLEKKMLDGRFTTPSGAR